MKSKFTHINNSRYDFLIKHHSMDYENFQQHKKVEKFMCFIFMKRKMEIFMQKN